MSVIGRKEAWVLDQCRQRLERLSWGYRKKPGAGTASEFMGSNVKKEALRRGRREGEGE